MLLGVLKQDRLHIRFARGHENFVSLPASCTCRTCGTLNEVNKPFAPAEPTNSRTLVFCKLH